MPEVMPGAWMQPPQVLVFPKVNNLHAGNRNKNMTPEF